MSNDLSSFAFERFKVQKRPGFRIFNRYCVLIGTGTKEVSIGSKTQCMEMASFLRSSFLDGAFVQTNNFLLYE